MDGESTIPVPETPLASWAERQVGALIAMTKAPALSNPGGAGLLVERAVLNGFTVPGLVSTGGGCRLMPARDGWVAINLARPDDRALLPALFCDTTLDPDNDGAITAHVATGMTAELVARGREMGLAIASADETPASPALCLTTPGTPRTTSPARVPLVIDLSALWAGPLAGHLLWLAGAKVVKVESRTRPDSMRDGDPALFALLHQGKANVALDLHHDADRTALLALIARADMVIEAARPRALRQLGIDADAIVRQVPGLVWTTITGHGVIGDAADWVGFGDDCGVAGGLSAALRSATGRIGFVGDAIADPATGIAAARATWERWSSGEGGRLILSMSGAIRAALDTEQARARATLDTSLKHWAATVGHPIAQGSIRTPTAPVATLGQNSAQWLGALPC